MASVSSVSSVEDEPRSLTPISPNPDLRGRDVVPAVMLGEDGLVEARRSTPGLVLLDLMLPGIAGGDVLEHPSREGSRGARPVIVVTAASGGKNERRARGLGATDYLVKPFAVPAMRRRNATALYNHTRAVHRDRWRRRRRRTRVDTVETHKGGSS